ncbi:MAG: CBS domain-containing protein [Flavobacteriaceae bacterium]
MPHHNSVSTIMTAPVVTLKKKDTLEHAEHLFKKNKIRHIPVVSGNAVVGMLSYNDLKRLSFVDIADENSNADALIYKMFNISQVMTDNIVTVSASNSIREAAKIFAENEFHALPVVNNNALVGIVTTTDMIKYLLTKL